MDKDDQNLPPHTTTSTLGQFSTSKASALVPTPTLTKAEKGHLSVMLTALASHYWRPDFSPSQAAVMWADFADDLADCTIPEIEVAIREYRRDPANKFFPKSADLRAIVWANRKHRADLEKIGKPVSNFDSRPIMWWTQPKALWNPNWRENDVPIGQMIKDTTGGPMRLPERVG